MSSYRSSLNTSRSYHRYFSALRGVDFTSDPSEVSLSHFTYVENMWCDPVSLDGVATETFPGYRIFARLNAPIYGLYRHRVAGTNYLVVHAGKHLYRYHERLRNYERTLATVSPYDVTLPEEAGCAFSFGETLFLLIGGEYLQIAADGTLSSLSNDPSRAYVPLTYYNGEPYEQRNLLTDSVRLSFSADGDYSLVTGEEGLLFTVYNEEEKSCMVEISEKYRDAGRVCIPSIATIDGKLYTVKVIAPNGFSYMTHLVDIEIPETVTIIGAKAFYSNTALRTISLSPETHSIGTYAFCGCLSLQRIYLGTAVELIGECAFEFCESLTEVLFGANETAYNQVIMEGTGTLKDRAIPVTYFAAPMEHYAVYCRFPLSEPCLSIEAITLAELPLTSDSILVDDVGIWARGILTDGRYSHVELAATNARFLVGKTLTVTAKVVPIYFSTAGTEVEGKRLLLGCRTVEKFDGRIFFTGNPDFPNTVLYTALDDTGVSNPFYIGALSYFNDGFSAIPNRALLSSGNELLVFKSDAGDDGEIFYHAAASGGSDLLPRIYPTVSAAPGIGVCGPAFRYANETLFLSKEGLFEAERNDLGTTYRLRPRSTAVNARLCREDIENASAAVFEGMLYLLVNGNIYLADSRRRTVHTGGSSEYEWYFLTGIGSYAGDAPVYRYSAYLPEGSEEYALTVHPSVGEIANGEIYSVTLSSGEKVYYEKSDAGHFPVDSDGERTGGIFSPATRLLATENALYFATADGALGCFNTDKRGLSLYHTVQSPLYIFTSPNRYLPLSANFGSLFSEDMVFPSTLYERSGDSYTAVGKGLVYSDGDFAALVEPIEERVESGRIHRYYYSYASHAYTAGCALAQDYGDIPHYAKDTLPGTAVIKLKPRESGEISVFVRTDRHPYALLERVSANAADAGNADFAAFDFHSDEVASFPLREKERGWCFKQYLFLSNKYQAPFGIFSLTYSFRPSGRVKP